VIARTLKWLAAVAGGCAFFVGAFVAVFAAGADHARTSVVATVAAVAGLAIALWAHHSAREGWRRQARQEARVGLVLGRMRWLKWGIILVALGVLVLLCLIGAIRAARGGELASVIVALLFTAWPAAYIVRTAAFGIEAERIGWVFRIGRAGVSHCAAVGLVPWDVIDDVEVDQRGVSSSSEFTSQWLVFRLQPGVHRLRTLRPLFWLWGSGGMVQSDGQTVRLNLDYVQGSPDEILALVRRAAGRHGWNRTQRWMRKMKLQEPVTA
jgi:hypothetical protein